MTDDTPKKEERGHSGGVAQSGIDLIEELVLDVPDSFAEAVWRIFSVMGLSALLIAGFMFWRYPHVMATWIDHTASPLLTDRLAENKSSKDTIMTEISNFIHRTHPIRFALVSWPTSTTGEIVWDTGGSNDWPVSLDGIFSPNLIPAVGPMVFGECWEGSFIADQWFLCPISDDKNVWGFVITQWQAKPTENNKRSLRHLAQRIEEMLY